MKLLKHLFVISILFGSSLPVHADEEVNLPAVSIVDSTDLRQDAQLARDRNLPLLVFFGSEYCGYCRIVEEDHLKPMLRSAEYRDKVIIRRIRPEYDKIINFDGTAITKSELASHYRASMTPTVIFLGPDGKELAPAIIGMRYSDYYGQELDLAIDQALGKLRKHLAFNKTH